MLWNALITAPFSKEGLAQLRKKMKVTYESWRETNKMYTDSRELTERIKRGGFNVLIVEGDNVDEELIDTCDLRIIACSRGNPMNIDIDAATKKMIPVIYTPARNADAVADMALLLMLSMARHLTAVDRYLRSGGFKMEREEDLTRMFEKFAGVELGLRTVGIVGFGAIGYRVAKRLAGFGSKILIYDPFVKPTDPRLREVKGEMVAKLEKVARESDFLTVHAAALPETEKLISKALIGMMKPTAYFINTSRGFIVDEEALYEAVKEKRIAGAGLDVVTQEPLESGNRWLDLDNVTATPHIGGNTVDVVKHQSEMIVRDIELLLEGKRPEYLRNPEVLARQKTKRSPKSK